MPSIFRFTLQGTMPRCSAVSHVICLASRNPYLESTSYCHRMNAYLLIPVCYKKTQKLGFNERAPYFMWSLTCPAVEHRNFDILCVATFNIISHIWQCLADRWLWYVTQSHISLSGLSRKETASGNVRGSGCELVWPLPDNFQSKAHHK